MAHLKWGSVCSFITSTIDSAIADSKTIADNQIIPERNFILPFNFKANNTI